MNFQKILSKDLTNESYHNRPKSLSSSGVKDCAKSFATYEFNKANRTETGSMSLGTLLHTAILEPELFSPILFPENFKKKDDIIKTLEVYETRLGNYGLKYSTGKLTVAKLELVLSTYRKSGIQTATQKQLDLVESMKKGIQQHEDLGLEGANLLSLTNVGHETETSFFVPIQALEGFEDCKLELELRIRPDYFIGGQYMADLKSTKTADPAKFKYEVFKYGYHVSAAFYLDCYNAYVNEERNKGNLKGVFIDGIFEHEIHEFKLVACENTGTGICTNFELSQELIEEGRQIYKRGLQNYIDYQKGFVYGGYSQKIVTL